MRLSLILCVLLLTAGVFFTAVQSLTQAGNAEIQEIQAQFADDKARLTQDVQDLDTKNIAQLDQLTAVMADLEDAQAESDALQKANAELQTTLSTLGSDLTNQSGALDDAKASTAALNDTIAKGVAEQQALTDKIAQLELEIANNAALGSDIASDTTETQAAMAARIAELEAQSAAKTDALAAAEDRIAEMSDAAADQDQSASDLTDQITGFEEQISTLTANMIGMSDIIEDRDSVIAELQSSIPSPALSCQERSDAVFAGRTIGFEAGTTTLTADSTALLADLAPIVVECAQNDLVLDVEGHTDNTGGQASNLLLSNGRAKVVHDYFVANGVPDQDVRAVGFGADEPRADLPADADPTLNQRIVLYWKQR